MALMDINLTGQAFSDYKLTDVGVAAYQLEHDWFTKQDLQITTGAGGGGIPLVEGVDYQLVQESEDDPVMDVKGLSTRVTAAMGATRNVFHKVQIINAAYQTGDLYHSGKYIADSNNAEDQIPTGAILPFGGTAAPDGWLMCNGAAVSRWIYRRLFGVIGTAYGVGDGATTFNIPNGQGVSLTGTGSQAINGRTKTGPALGAAQEDAMQGHRHSPLAGSNFWMQTGGAALTGTGVSSLAISTGDPVTDTVNGTPRTGAYTRGPGIGVNFIIKT